MQITVPNITVKEAEAAKYAAEAAAYTADFDSDLAGAKVAYMLADAALKAAKELEKV
jgi:hypothetical protein